MKRLFLFALACTVSLPWLSTGILAQTRDELVRNDRNQLMDDLTWYYDDLEKGMAAAKKKNKPLMVVLRCIP